MFHLEAGGYYWLSETSTLCSDEGAISVTDKDECYLTLPDVQSVYPNATQNILEEFTSSEYPTGCFLYMYAGGIKVYFNSHETGGRYSNGSDICKGDGK